MGAIPRLLRRQDDSTYPIVDATQAIATALLGPVLLGDCLQLILFGILVSAVFSYLNSGSYARTSKFSQVIVAAVVLLTTLSTMLDVGDIWFYGTLQTRTEASLLSGTLIESCEPLLVGVIGALVETVLVVRAAKMFVERRNMIIFVVASGIVILVGLVGAIGTMVWGYLYYVDPFLVSDLQPTFNQCGAIWLTCSAGADCAITGAFIYQLRSRVKPTGFNRSTASAFRLVVTLAVQSAATTSIVAFVGAVVSLVYHGNDLMTTDILYAWWLPLPGLYALSLFSTLSVPGKVERRLRKKASSGGFGFTSTSKGKVETADPERAPPAASVDGVNVRVEHWVEEEEHGGKETRSGDVSDLPRLAKTMEVAPGHLCPQ